MTKKFSTYLKKKKPILKELLQLLLEEYSYASILATDVSGTNFRVDQYNYVIAPTSITECGFVIKVYYQGLYSEYAISSIERNDFAKILANIQDLVKAKSIVAKRNVPLFEEEEMVKKFNRSAKGREYLDNEIIANLKQGVEYGMQNIPNVINVGLVIEELAISKMFLSAKKDLEQFYPWKGARSLVVVRRDDNMKYAYEGFGSINTEENLQTLHDRILDIGKLANELLDSELPKPGVYDIITDPSITGLIAHEAFGHGVEMDMFVKDRARSVEYLNKQVASPLITMHDGAAATFSCSSYFFDDDGILAQDTVIIEKGILKRGISDSLSALELGTKPTGNGRRESYKRKSYTRMTNTFFEKGHDKLSEMIKSIKHGYFISTTDNGMEDPKNWGIQCTAQYGREIVDGEFTGKIISPVVMSGYVIDLLNSITAVSDDFNVIGSGSCGKGYKEWVRVSDGGPCLKAKVKIG